MGCDEYTLIASVLAFSTLTSLHLFKFNY